MQIRTTVLNDMLNGLFNISETDYTIILTFDGSVVGTPMLEETVVFTSASGGSISLESSIFFAVEGSSQSPTSINGLKVQTGGIDLITETFTTETFTTNGTFTVNDIIVTLSGS